MTNHTFHSRVDIWLILSLGGSIVLCAYLAWSLRVEEPVASGIAVFIGISLVFTYGYGLIPCKYTLESTCLKIQLGRSVQSVAYLDILKWAPELSFASGPTLSLRRVRIEYRGGEVYVSPRRRETFMAELQRRVEIAKKQ